MKNNGMPFTEWYRSRHNPLHGCSKIAEHFTREALQAAFEAGELHHARKLQDAKDAAKRERERERERNIFDYDPLSQDIGQL